MTTGHGLQRAISRTLLLLSFISVGTERASAQKNAMELGFGLGYYARQDQTFSPFVHKDFSPLNFRLGYQRNARAHQFAGIEFGSFNPILTPSYTYDSDEETVPHSFLLVNVTYGLGRQVRLSSDSLVLGGFFEADIESSTYNYARTGAFGYLASLSLGTFVRYERPLSTRIRSSVRLLLPLVSHLARSPYLVNDDEFIENTYSHKGFNTFMAFLEDGKLQTWNRIQQVELDVRCTWALNSRWDLAATYAFRFLHASRPTNFLSYRHTLYLSAALTF